MHYAGKTPVEWKIQMRIARSALTIKPLKSDFHHNCIPQFSLCLQILTYRHSLAQSHAVSHPPTDTHACSHSLWLSFTCALFLSHTHSMRQSQDECSVIAGKKQSHNRKSGAAALTNIHKIFQSRLPCQHSIDAHVCIRELVVNIHLGAASGGQILAELLLPVNQTLANQQVCANSSIAPAELSHDNRRLNVGRVKPKM